MNSALYENIAGGIGHRNILLLSELSLNKKTTVSELSLSKKTTVKSDVFIYLELSRKYVLKL